MSSYKVSVGGEKPVRVRSFRDARGVVAAAMTDLLARDPEAVARGVMAVNLAFETGGAAEHSLAAHGRWSTTVTVGGEPVLLAVEKRWW